MSFSEKTTFLTFLTFQNNERQNTLMHASAHLGFKGPLHHAHFPPNCTRPKPTPKPHCSVALELLKITFRRTAPVAAQGRLRCRRQKCMHAVHTVKKQNPDPRATSPALCGTFSRSLGPLRMVNRMICGDPTPGAMPATVGAKNGFGPYRHACALQHERSGMHACTVACDRAMAV